MGHVGLMKNHQFLIGKMHENMTASGTTRNIFFFVKYWKICSTNNHTSHMLGMDRVQMSKGRSKYIIYLWTL